MVDLLSSAEAIARTAHATQLYAGKSYIDAHVKPVVEIIRRLGYDHHYQAAGWLHDVIEDTPITPTFLTEKGIPQQVVRAVLFVSKQPKISHADYLQGIISDPYATVVKFADSSANFASTVMLSPQLPDIDFQRMVSRYASNIAVLQPRLPRPSFK